jgi:hypothetical protein
MNVNENPFLYSGMRGGLLVDKPSVFRGIEKLDAVQIGDQTKSIRVVNGCAQFIKVSLCVLELTCGKGDRAAVV